MSTRNNNHNGGEDAVTGNIGDCSSIPIHDSFKGVNYDENEKGSHHNRHVRFSMSSTSTHIFRSTTYDDDSSGDNYKGVEGGEDNDHCVEATSPQRASTSDNNTENDKDEPGSDSRCQPLKSSVRTSRYDNKRDGRGYQPQQQQHQRTCHLGRKSRQLRVRKMLQEQIRRNDSGSGNSNDDHDSHHDSHHEDDVGQTTSTTTSSSPNKESRQPQEVPQRQQRRIYRHTQRRHSKPNHHNRHHHKNCHVNRQHSNSSNKKALVVENEKNDDDDDDDVFSGGTHSTAVCSSSIFSGSGSGNCNTDEGEDEDKRNSPPVSPTGITIDTDKYLKTDCDNGHDDIILNITDDWKIRQRTMTY